MKNKNKKKKMSMSEIMQKRLRFCVECIDEYTNVINCTKSLCAKNKKAFGEKTKLTRGQLNIISAIDKAINDSNLFGPYDKEYLEVGPNWVVEGTDGYIAPTATNVWGVLKAIEAMAEMAVTTPQ